MRPRGEVRDALRSAFEQLGAMTLRTALPSLPVSADSPAERQIVRRTLTNMVHAGELVRCGKERAADSQRWVAVYEIPLQDDTSTPQPWGGIEALASVVTAWREPR